MSEKKEVKKVQKELKHVEKVLLPGSKKRKSGRRRGAGRGAYVSQAATIQSTASQKLRVHGTDRFVHIPNCVGKGEGTVIVDTEVSAESFARLKHISEAYQRYHFKKLVFRVVPMASTDFSGGYVASFVADASDVIGSGGDALNRLVAQAGAKITKIWQSAVISHQCLPDLLYTSEPPGGDIRLSSPGRFVLALDSAVTGVSDKIKVPVTVYCDWEAMLYEPTLEGPHAKVAGQLTVGKPLYTRSEEKGLWSNDSDSNVSSAIPGITLNETYQTSHDVFLRFETEGGNYSKVRYLYDTTDKKYRLLIVGHDDKAIEQKTDVNYWALQIGDKLTPVAKNLSKGEEYLCLKKTGESSPNKDKQPIDSPTDTDSMEDFILA